MLVHGCSPRTGEEGGGGLEDESHPRLQPGLAYLYDCLPIYLSTYLSIVMQECLASAKQASAAFLSLLESLLLRNTILTPHKSNLGQKQHCFLKKTQGNRNLRSEGK